VPSAGLDADDDDGQVSTIRSALAKA